MYEAPVKSQLLTLLAWFSSSAG